MNPRKNSSWQYSLVQLNLFLVEIGDFYIYFGWMWYGCQRRKKLRYYLFNIRKSRVLDCRYTFTTDECLSADKIVLRHSLKGFTGIFTMINILVTEENIVNDFLIQFPCWWVVYLGQNLSIIKGTRPSGQVPLLNMSELTYSSTAACAAARRAMGTRKGEQLA